jgi:uncharacterized protein (TIGR00645 family)
MSHETPNAPARNRAIQAVESVLFNVKWILPLFYLGLAFVLALYGLAYLKEILKLAAHGTSLSTEDMKIVVLDFVDVVMVANLVKMIIGGSYNSFVSKLHGRPNENVSSGTLKIKISTSIVIVCSIHLLRMFVADHQTAAEVSIKLQIFYAFLAATLVLGVLEYLHILGELREKEFEHKEKKEGAHA